MREGFGFGEGEERRQDSAMVRKVIDIYEQEWVSEGFKMLKTKSHWDNDGVLIKPVVTFMTNTHSKTLFNNRLKTCVLQGFFQ